MQFLFRILVRLRDREREGFVEDALRLDPKSATAFAGRCSAYNSHEEVDRALADCNAAIRLDPKSAAAYATEKGITVRDCAAETKVN